MMKPTSYDLTSQACLTRPFGLLLVLLCVLLSPLLKGCGGGGSGTQNNTPVDNGGDPPPLAGLDARPTNTTCLAPEQAPAASIQLSRIAANLSFSSPLLMLAHPNESGIYYVVEQRGAVYRLDLLNQSRALLVDLSDHYSLSGCGECGLLGMAFHPDFANTGALYLSFMEDRGGDRISVVARFSTTDSAVSLDNDITGAPRRNDVLEVAQPFGNHNGGHIAFGPDGFLYLGLGDGGSGNDPNNNAQDVTTLLGSMLRLRDDGTPAPGNVVNGGLPELYAYGLRNPWRWSFDRTTGDLWLGDVGQSGFEEVDIIINGGNYGWRCLEGVTTTANNCSTSGPYIAPVAVYDHSEGNSITGGYVYRGNAIPSLAGNYLFGDFGSGAIWAVDPDAPRIGPTTPALMQKRLILNSGLAIASFAEAPDGELFVVSYAGGLYQIENATADPHGTPATNLADTGCVAPNNPMQPASGLIPYAINEPFWSDGAAKQRYLALPDDTRIEVNAAGDFIFPVGTVLIKNFNLNNRRIETRLYMQQAEARWFGYSYRWNESETQATLLNGAFEQDYDGQRWHFPSGEECTQCHTVAANFSLALEARQMNRDFTYPSTGITANQLSTLEAIDLFTTALPANVVDMTMPASNDANADLTERARSYLHSNCSHCHRPGATSQSTMDLRFGSTFAEMNLCNATPLNGDLGITGATLLTPSMPDQSLLLERMQRLDSQRMPPLASSLVDNDGITLIRQWINSISNCDGN